MQPRPKYNSDIALAAARVIAGQLRDEGLLSEAELDGAARDIAKHAGPHKDGYEIARDLERFCFWSCDMRTAEVLDCFSGEVDRLLAQAEKEWAESEKPQPPLPIGSRVKMRDGTTGVIDGIYEYRPARFTVKEDGDREADSKSMRRRIVNFEDAVAA